MNKAVIIVTHEANDTWLKNMLSTIPLDIYVHYNFQVYKNTFENNGYELAAIEWAYNQGYDEFILLHDTMEVKDPDIFDQMFDTPGSVSLGPGFLMYIGKYTREDLQRYGIPKASSKREAVAQEVEADGFCKTYANGSNASVFDYSFTDTHNFVEMFGNKCMVLENEYLRKFKRTWDLPMIKEFEKPEVLNGSI